MKKTIDYVIAIILMLACFSIGYKFHKPIIQEKIKEVIKEIKVYDFTQSPEMIEAYANTNGLTLQSLKDYEAEKNKLLSDIEGLKKQNNSTIENLKFEIETEKLRIELKKLRGIK